MTQMIHTCNPLRFKITIAQLIPTVRERVGIYAALRDTKNESNAKSAHTQNLSRVIGSFAKNSSAVLCKPFAYLSDTKKSIAKAFLILLTFFFFLLGSSQANNIQVSNGKVVFNNATSVFVEFDLSWENSWRDGINWDAAWVFVKFRVVGGAWQHAWLSTNNTHHSSGTGTGATINIGTTTISSSPRGMGAFIYRTEEGSGTFTLNKARIQWNFGEQGIAASSSVEIRVFAIEMVYVAQGEFAAGDGANGFALTTINTAVATTVPEGIGSLGGAAGGYPTGQTAPNAAWPNGFAAFYMMKYETTQQQYVEFLNTITRTQQQVRFPSTVVGRFMHSSATQTTPAVRNGVKLMSDPGGTAPRVFGCDLNNNNTAGEVDDGKWIAMHWMSWLDVAAYMDWSGLRPMTELEFEKAARGPSRPLVNEYAWGTADIASTAYTLSDANKVIEDIATNYNTSGTIGNSLYSTTSTSIGGPVRVGIFAANTSNTGRITSGASYWGIMELSGNVFEFVVSMVNEAGRSYTGVHGDGTLDGSGQANVDFWPGINGNSNVSIANQVWNGTTGITQAAGSGLRGFIPWNITPGLRVSNRDGITTTSITRPSYYGFRGVRSAPQ